MKIAQTVCDECKRVRGEENHWLKVGVLVLEDKSVQLTLGVVPEKSMPGYEVHDICGEQCFHMHIDRLLGATMEPHGCWTYGSAPRNGPLGPVIPQPLPLPLPEGESIPVEAWRSPDMAYIGI